MSKILRAFSRHRVFTRAISMLLAILLTFYVIPTVIYAEIADAFSNIGDSTAGEEEIAAREENDEIYEDVSRREESVKHFRLSDGTYVAAQYPHPVHYTNEDGEYEDIDNTLSEASGGVYATPNARIKFAKKITGNAELFTLHDGNTKLRMSLIGAKGGVAGVVANGEDAEEATVLQKMMNLEKLVSRILYEDILDGVDVEYVAESLTVKENIIVKERKDSYSYSFELKLNGLTAALSDNGDVEIFVSGTEEIKYVIPAPVVYDADGVHAPEGVAYYTLTDGGNGKYTLTVTVSSGWMNAEERAFPVTVDPTVGVPQSQIVDTYVSSDYPNASYSSAIRMYADAKRHAYWRVSDTSLPSVPSYAYLIKAEIQLFGGGDDALVGAYLVTSDWDSTLTWNKTVSEDPQGALGTAVQSYNIVSNGYSWYTWDVTDAVRAWYSGDNYGIGFRLMDGSDNTKVASFHTANESYSKPVLSVTYRDMKGVESYWPYSSHSAGTAGVGSINLATGQLSLAIPTLTTTTGIMPYTVSLVYNSGLAGMDHNSANSNIAYSTSYMPYGFKLNICETVVAKSYVSATGETKATYIYTDADGTEHYMYNSGDGVYRDEDGLGLELTQNSGILSIKDRSNTVREFNSMGTSKWHLSKIKDVSGNAIVFTVDSAYRPTEISLDPAGSEPPIELLELWYNSDGKLVMIYNRSSKEAAVLRYSAVYDGDLVTSDTKYLRSIDFAHGNSYVTDTDWNLFITSRSNTYSLTLDSYSIYNYSSTGYIWQYRNTSADTYIEYILSSGRYTGVAERSQSNNDVGQSLRLFYGNGYTDVLSSGSDDISGSSDDIVTRYVMDPHGRAVSIYSSSVDGSDIYGATMGVYDSGEESKNSLKQQTALGGVSVNYLVNGGFESEIVSTLNWGMAGTAERFSDYSKIKDGDYAMDLSPTLGATARIYQTVTLTEGDYTLSFPYLTHYCDGTDVVVSISGYGVSYTENIGKNPNNSNGVQSFFSTTFTVPTTASYTITIFATAQSVGTYNPVVNIDNVMLSKGVGASDYTMVTYGSMEESGGMARSTVWTGSGFEFAESEIPFDTTVKVTATTTGETYAKQRIYTAPAAYLSAFDINPANVNNAVSRYLVSGFAKAENAVLGNPDGFSMRLDVAYYQGSGNDDEIVTHRVTFIPSVTGWQFATAEFSTALEYDTENDIDYRCIRYIDLVCEYSYQQAGTVAYFDNVSVIKNIDNSESYSYDANGNVAIIKGAHYSEYYVYDENNNLITSANTLGNMVEYTYTSAGLVSTETVSYVSGAMGKTYEEYAAGTVVGTPKSRTSYTYDIYGLTAMVETIELSSSGTQAANTYPIRHTYIYDITSGSKIFGVMLRDIEYGGATMRYFYNSSNGRLDAVLNLTDGNGYYYEYDGEGKMTQVLPATFDAAADTYDENDSAEQVNYTYDAADRLSTITTASTTYTLTYDLFGNTASVKAGDNTLATYIYNQFNGKLNTIVYGNGYAEEYVYDTLENISEIWYTVGGVDTLAYSYEYNADGSVYKIIDHVNGTETVHKYDLSGRVIAVNRYDVTDKDHDLSSSITYDDSGRVNQIKYGMSYAQGANVLGESFTYDYVYNDDSTIYRFTYRMDTDAYYRTYYGYDNLGRVKNVSATYESDSNTEGSFSGNVVYTYETRDSHTTSNVAQYSSTINGVTTTYTYTYDNRGNITRIIVTGASSYAIEYAYDDQGQLIMQEDSRLNKTTVYTYDDAGNILSYADYRGIDIDFDVDDPEGGRTFGYSSSSWGDMLTRVNGSTITYDDIGNPLNYYNGKNYNFTWLGRQLASATVGGKTYTYTYNDAGIRASKTVDGVTTTYYYDGNLLISEQTPTYTIIYIYDANGSPIGMQYRLNTYAADTWDVYWFEKNLQGDIVAVYDATGTKLISYIYDAWGNQNVTYHNGGANTGAAKNPFTYRGYYYDRDIGFYYLQSRYYDPAICRFISADNSAVIAATPDALTDKNLFAYCDNNPVMRRDDSGEFWNVLIGAAVGAVAGVVGQFISDAVTSLLNGEITISNWQTYAGAAVGGAAGGVVLATTGNINAANAVTGAVTTGVGQSLEKITISNYNKTWTEIAANVAIDGVISYGLGKIPGINGATAGRNSWSAVYRSGLTKLRNGTVARMSVKVIVKGLASSIIGGFALDGYYGVKQHAYDRIKNLLP